MARLLITRPLPERVLAEARALADVTARDSTAPMSEAEMVQALRDYDAILPTLGDLFSAEIFARVPEPRTRLLANFGMGYSHIDTGAAPGAVTDAPADIALTLMLMTCRRAGEGDRLVRSGKWEGWHPTQMLGLHMSGKRLGVVGMGRIGKAIARRGHHGFGMEVGFFNRSQVSDPGVPARQVPALIELAGWADVLVVAVPASPATRHLIGAEVLAAMQPHAHLVNIGRGDVVDEAALIAALQAGRIGGAGLDVYEHEPEVPAALRGLENVTLLPHLGTAALEVREAMGLVAVENIRAHLAGAPPPNVVN